MICTEYAYKHLLHSYVTRRDLIQVERVMCVVPDTYYYKWYILLKNKMPEMQKLQVGEPYLLNMRYSSSLGLWPVPSKSFQIYSLWVILPFNDI
jgi:hypothetical protein